jgi:hypothetical protein
VAPPQAVDRDVECARIPLLLELIRASDESALNELMKIIGWRATAWARGILGAVDPQDVVQHVNVQLWRRTPRWEGCKPFFDWVKQTSRNAALDQIRKNKSGRVVPLDPIVVKTGSGQRLSPDRSVYTEEAIQIGLSLVKEPHQTMCLLANKMLGDPPARIVPKRVKPLATWLDEMAVRCPLETPVADASKWHQWLLPLKAAMRQKPASKAYLGPKERSLGQTSLIDYGLPTSPMEAAKVITEWVYSAKRRLLATVGETKRGG